MSGKIIQFTTEEQETTKRVEECRTIVYHFLNLKTGEERYQIEVPQGSHMKSCEGCYWRVAELLRSRGFEADYSDSTMMVLTRGKSERKFAQWGEQLPENAMSMQRQTMHELSRRLNNL